MPQDTPINRRRFFREGLRELLRPLAEAVEPLQEAAPQLAEVDGDAHPRRVSLEVWLRPPGALPEKDFLEACSRCGDCVRVCPAQCIKIDPAGRVAGGLPYIQVDSMPCVVCDGLYCMEECPTGALVPTPLAEIDMGTAVWHEQSCVRGKASPSGSNGAECTICIDHCPLGSAAIELRDEKVKVIEEGCIGCGVCQYYCPTSPKSITIVPSHHA